MPARLAVVASSSVRFTMRSFAPNEGPEDRKTTLSSSRIRCDAIERSDFLMQPVSRKSRWRSSTKISHVTPGSCASVLRGAATQAIVIRSRRNTNPGRVATLFGRTTLPAGCRILRNHAASNRELTRTGPRLGHQRRSVGGPPTSALAIVAGLDLVVFLTYFVLALTGFKASPAGDVNVPRVYVWSLVGAVDVFVFGVLLILLEHRS